MTDREPFTPSRADGRSLHQVAFEYVSDLIQRGELEPGGVVPHEQLAAEMGVEYPSSSYFQSVRKASDDMQLSMHRSLVSVRGEGYKLIQGVAMVDLGRRQQGRAKRQMSRALSTVESVSEAHLASADERVSLALVRRGFSIVSGVLSQQAETLAQHDEEISSLKNARQADSARLAAMEAQLRRMRGESTG